MKINLLHFSVMLLLVGCKPSASEVDAFDVGVQVGINYELHIRYDESHNIERKACTNESELDADIVASSLKYCSNIWMRYHPSK